MFFIYLIPQCLLNFLVWLMPCIVLLIYVITLYKLVCSSGRPIFEIF